MELKTIQSIRTVVEVISQRILERPKSVWQVVSELLGGPGHRLSHRYNVRVGQVPEQRNLGPSPPPGLGQSTL